MIEFTVNGERRQVEAAPTERLLDVLRLRLGLTGAKEGCGEGECGSCSVYLDGELVNACLVPLLQVEGREVRTVEWLETDPLGQKLQRCFAEHGGAQCGICTPGMLLASHQLLSDNPTPTSEQVREGLSGNLCRCTGYTKIFDSVLAAGQS